MDYELKVLEHVISNVLDPTKLMQGCLNAEFLSECKLLAETEKERIKKEFIKSSFTSIEDNYLKSYFQQHQRALVRLADCSMNYIQEGNDESIYALTNDSKIINIYKEIAKMPEELLHFMQENFESYFDPTIKLPEAKKSAFVPKVEAKLEVLQLELRKVGLNDEAINMVCKPFEDFLVAELPVNYGKLNYLKGLHRALMSFTKRKIVDHVNVKVCRLLLYLNYNCMRFFNYYIIQLRSMAAGLSANEQIAFYSYQFKLVNQMPGNPGMTYQPGNDSIRTAVSNWITEEMNYIEKRDKLLKLEESLNNPMENEGKVRTSLSVAQLALGIKLLVDSKIITNRNSAELMRMVARNFCTAKQESISEDSLRNKSYSFESGTVEKMKDVIIGMMNRVRGY